MSLLVICQILRHFANTLIADDKYSLCNNELLYQPIQIQLSKKQKTFLNFFATFIRFPSIFEKPDTHSLFISEVRECKRRG